jgi:predicted nucleic acid-binding protein
MRAAMTRRGKVLVPVDLLIAAHALRRSGDGVEPFRSFWSP